MAIEARFVAPRFVGASAVKQSRTKESDERSPNEVKE